MRSERLTGKFFSKASTLGDVMDWSSVPSGRTLSLKCKRKPDLKISKFKARYCVRGDIQKILSPKPLNSYSPVVQWATVRLMLILQCILGLQSQSIDFTNAFDEAGIIGG